MREVKASEAGEQLPEILSTVEDGESVVITRDGEDIAYIVPDLDPERTGRRAGIRQFMKFRTETGGIKATVEEILAWRHEGHRF